jgi:UDP-GlcNAc:undecaprenyl-phosphate GlcNAc-1-phosphate transferase
VDPIFKFQLLATGVLLATFMWAWIETRLSIWFANEMGLLAQVTPRSAHRVPMPTVGGMAIADTVLITAIILNLLPRRAEPMIYAPGVDGRFENWILILCGAVIAMMGFIDDWKVVRPLPKFLVQVICAIPPAWIFRRGPWLGEDSWVWLSALGGEHAWIWVAFGLNLIWLLVIINLMNFMDGMDGFAAIFSAVAACGLGALALLQAGNLAQYHGLGEILFVTLALAGALLGFLRFNLPPAQTFMGDVGSQFLGWLLGTLALMAHVPLQKFEVGRTLWPVSWAPLLLFLPILGDGLFTMGRRALRGENILKPHFSHLYQRLLTCGRSHTRVLAVEFLVMASCAVLTILLLFVRPRGAPLIGLAGLGVFLTLWLHVRAVETEPPRHKTDNH